VPSETALLLTEEVVPPAPLTVQSVSCCAASQPQDHRRDSRLLWVTPATVSKHLEHVYRKLDVTSRTAALAKLRVAGTEDSRV
jgi:hypothetical protein